MAIDLEEPTRSAFSNLGVVACSEPDVYFSMPCPLFRAAAKARGSNLRVHYKHMREVAHLIQGMKLSKSKQYLQVCTQISVDFGHHNPMSVDLEL